jgi:hypothetical protein
MLLVAIFVLSSVSPTIGQTEKNKRFGFEKARVVIEKTMKNPSVESKTIDTVYIDQFGYREARVSHTFENILMLKQKRESRSVSFIEGEWITSYDPVTRKGSRMKNPLYKSLSNLDEKQQQKMAKGMEEAFKAKTTELATETIAGKPCKVTRTVTGLQGMETTTTTWLWEGLPMKSLSGGMGTELSELVTNIKEGIGIPGYLSEIPKDVVLMSVGGK